MKTLRINLVDDHKVVIDGLQAVLTDEPDLEILDVATSGEQLLRQLKLRQPDVLVLDYSLTDRNQPEALNGYETAIHVMDYYPEVQILMLTMHNISEVMVPCVEKGIQGYMLKSERNFDVAAAIRQLYRQGHYFSPEIAGQLALSMKQYRADYIDITKREKDVLEALFTGLSTKEIGESLFISNNTVETHRKNLMSKFEAKNSLHLVYKALQRGMLRVPSFQ